MTDHEFIIKIWDLGCPSDRTTWKNFWVRNSVENRAMANNILIKKYNAWLHNYEYLVFNNREDWVWFKLKYS